LASELKIAGLPHPTPLRDSFFTDADETSKQDAAALRRDGQTVLKGFL
jgi:hypothetical protein